MKDDILNLFNRGFSYNEIRQKLRCSKSTISYYCSKLDNPRKDVSNRRFCNCKQCGKILNLKASKILTSGNFCSNSCSKSFYNKTNREVLVEAGRKSAKIQSESKRSKNEKLFFNLCELYFDKVSSNERLFNGWDADVILNNEKIAVLWNGKWHYKKITKKHSVKQVQNRDKIKIKEILNLGYTPYIIKDMGKFDPIFVKNMFTEFLTEFKL